MRYSDRIFIFFFSLILSAAVLNAQPRPEGIPPRPFHHFPPSPKDSDNILKYRGNRTYNENLPLKVNRINCVRKDGEIVCLEIIFNQNINPRSIKPYTLLINNNPLHPGVRFAFSKRGDTIKLFFPLNGNSFKLKIDGIRSFEGTVIEPVEFLVEISASL